MQFKPAPQLNTRHECCRQLINSCSLSWSYKVVFLLWTNILYMQVRERHKGKSNSASLSAFVKKVTATMQGQLVAKGQGFSLLHLRQEQK
eukprot:1160100-Pelagomonas_calceolata.AAC.6